MKNVSNQSICQSLTEITVLSGKLSVISDRVINTLHDVEILQEAYFNGQLEQELFETLPNTFNKMLHFVNTIQTIRVKSVIIAEISPNDPQKVKDIVLPKLPKDIDDAINLFHQKYGVRKIDWIQYMVHEMHLDRFMKSMRDAKNKKMCEMEEKKSSDLNEGF